MTDDYNDALLNNQSGADSVDDDLTGYIQESSFESLKKRFSAAEEDENIRNEGFELIKKTGLIVKKRPESTLPYELANIKKRDDINLESNNGELNAFEEAKSSLAGVDVDFTEIVLDNPESKPEPEIPAAEPVIQEEPPKPKKRGRPRKVKPEEAVKDEKLVIQQEHINTYAENISLTGNKYGFDTHTRVIYTDEEPEDGIKRNEDEELESLLMTEKKSKGFRFSLKKRRKKWVH